MANQYIYNWKTQSSYAGNCQQFTVRLADGANTLAERVLAQLLEGEGSSVRLLKTSSAGVVVDK